jgi:hypothetical protein
MGKGKSTEIITLSTGLQIKVRHGWRKFVFEHQYSIIATVIAVVLGITFAGVRNTRAEAEPMYSIQLEETAELHQPIDLIVMSAEGSITEIPFEDTENIEIIEEVEEQTDTIEETTEIAEYNPRYDTESDLYILAHLINAEAGATYCSDTMRYYVGSVVLNRVASSNYPNTIKGVVFDSTFGIQYACTVDGNYYKEPTEYCWEIAEYLLANGSILPSTVVFQAQFEQGTSTYAVEQNMYFCCE